MFSFFCPVKKKKKLPVKNLFGFFSDFFSLAEKCFHAHFFLFFSRPLVFFTGTLLVFFHGLKIGFTGTNLNFFPGWYFFSKNLIFSHHNGKIISATHAKIESKIIFPSINEVFSRTLFTFHGYII